MSYKRKYVCPPIIFIHYGNSRYLNYVLKAAQISNPDKKIILLGDKKNKQYTKYNIEHFNFNQFHQGNLIKEFESVYRYIAAPNQGRRKWHKFVFLKWFYLYNFLANNNINRFWAFDSDTLILASLKNKEDFLSNYDCTTQCKGNCLSGFITKDVVKRYLIKTNEIFTRKQFLNSVQNRLNRLNKYAFTEMATFKIFIKEENINTYRLNTINKFGTFDDGLIFQHDLDNIEMMYDMVLKKSLKKLYFKKGEVYQKNLENNELIRLLTINMSSLPIFYYKRIYNKVFINKNLSAIELFSKNVFFYLITFKYPWSMLKYLRKYMGKKGF